ncbi:unnamed protein product [Effrenium voratum]|nr:unnamed protein product [Effrenium voratum]
MLTTPTKSLASELLIENETSETDAHHAHPDHGSPLPKPMVSCSGSDSQSPTKILRTPVTPTPLTPLTPRTPQNGASPASSYSSMGPGPVSPSSLRAYFMQRDPVPGPIKKKPAAEPPATPVKPEKAKGKARKVMKDGKAKAKASK